MKESTLQPEVDPQDTAELSRDMAEAPVEQREIKCKSVFDGLVEFGKTHGKVFRTNGRHADMMRFDLTAHSVLLGNTFIVCRGEIKMPVLETASVKVDLTGLPWLTKDEEEIDPVVLFNDHYVSRPNGSERFMACNFPAKDVDELTDDEIAQGTPRAEARVRLEAWVLCAALDGKTLEAYVKRQPNWRPGNDWWSPMSGGHREGRELVIKTDWWRAADIRAFRLVERGTHAGRPEIWNAGNKIAELAPMLTPVEQRTLQMAEELRKSLASLADATFRMQVRLKSFECDPLINDANAILKYIERGKPASK